MAAGVAVTADAAALFREAFDAEPIGVWSAPGRVNLIGEHTDYTGGFVLPFAIEQRAQVAVRPREDAVVRGVARGHLPQAVDLADVALGSPTGWLGYLAGAAHVAESSHGWDIALDSDVPIGGGLSSSAAITCATLLAIDDVEERGSARRVLAELAQRVEHEVIGTPCGIMDQSASLRCERGHLLFMDTRSLDVVQVPWSRDDLVLLVTDTRAPHVLADGQYAHRRALCEQAAAALGVHELRDADLALLTSRAPDLTDDQFACAHHVITENARVLDVRELLENGHPELIGPLLTASHRSLRDDFKVTVPPLDVAVDAALDAGALGARMTGGGFGGCTIALVPAPAVTSVTSAIDASFAAHGFTAPVHFSTTPSQGARRER